MSKLPPKSAPPPSKASSIGTVPSSDEGLTLRGLQRRVDGWISQYEAGYFPPLASLARLSEEVGELARVLSHLDGFKKPKPGEPLGSLGDELGDILFVVVCLANQHGLDLNEVMEGVMHKIEHRDNDRWQKKAPPEGVDAGASADPE